MQAVDDVTCEQPIATFFTEELATLADIAGGGGWLEGL